MTSTLIKKFSLVGALTAALAVGLVLFFCDPVRVPIYPQCLFHQLTGLDCPGCGSLRALHAVLHGNLGAALHYNAFLILSLPLFAGVGLNVLRSASTVRPAVQIKPAWLWLYLAAYVTFGILRDLPVPVFAAFAP